MDYRLFCRVGADKRIMPNEARIVLRREPETAVLGWFGRLTF